MRLPQFSLALLLVVACEEAEPAGPSPFPTLPDASSDTTAGDATADATGLDATEGDADDPDAEPEPMTCEGASIAFIEALGAEKSSFAACTKDSDCELIVPKLECKASGVTIEECAYAVSDVLAYATALVAVTDALCPDVPPGCVATPGCPQLDAACTAGRCVAVPAEP